MTDKSREITQIRIRGARTHNLANLDLDLPRHALVVMTGPSGSGKSSLAFDTIYAEGQRRYVESLSVAARAFLDQLPRADVDLVEGLSPTIALDQTNRNRSPRSTVGTTTEVYDYLRLLFARVGEVVDEQGEVVRGYGVQEVVDLIAAWPERTKFAVVAPLTNVAAADLPARLDELRGEGFSRLAINGELYDLADLIDFAPPPVSEVEVFIDRLMVKPDQSARVADAIELARKVSGGIVRISPVEGEPVDYSERPIVAGTGGEPFPELTPALFSFNSPQGACPVCAGLGQTQVFDIRRLIPNPELSLSQGAIRPLRAKQMAATQRTIKLVAAHFEIDMNAPWSELEDRSQQVVLYGSGDELVPGLGGKKGQRYEGIVAALERTLQELEADAAADEDSGSSGDELRDMASAANCSACQGTRLRAEALRVKLAGTYNIAQLSALSVQGLLEVVSAVSLSNESEEIAQTVLKQARERLQCLVELGLSYLTLDRPTTTLSGGEAQRIRLATQVGTTLTGVTYVLDEPSIGLHQRDNGRLIKTLQRLRDLGNSVIVVEHDEDTIRAADYIVDMGPGAGVRGGRIVAAGTLDEVLANPRSRTAAYLSGREAIEVPKKRRRATKSIVIRNASGNNLQGVTARIPVGLLTCVTGVSGSGKSSLIVDTLLPEARRVLNAAVSYGLACDGVDGLDAFERVIHVDQAPIGRTARSNPATFTGIFAELRTLFAQLSESKVRGFQAARFSFNVKGGRCEVCEGEGMRRIEMHFLPDVWVACQSCKGRRYNRETLQVKYRGKSVADVLEMSIADACEFFGNHRKLAKKLETLRDVGLGYMALGQSALTLSGGEAQRLKLARELGRDGGGSTLFILDEPTTGLHMHDVEQLLKVLQRLVDEGNTVVVIEHHLDVVKSADFVIDVGPEGGSQGGQIVASGTPEHVSAQPESITAPYLASALRPVSQPG